MGLLDKIEDKLSGSSKNQRRTDQDTDSSRAHGTSTGTTSGGQPQVQPGFSQSQQPPSSQGAAQYSTRGSTGAGAMPQQPAGSVSRNQPSAFDTNAAPTSRQDPPLGTGRTANEPSYMSATAHESTKSSHQGHLQDHHQGHHHDHHHGHHDDQAVGESGSLSSSTAGGPRQTTDPRLNSGSTTTGGATGGSTTGRHGHHSHQDVHKLIPNAENPSAIPTAGGEEIGEYSEQYRQELPGSTRQATQAGIGSTGTNLQTRSATAGSNTTGATDSRGMPIERKMGGAYEAGYRDAMSHSNDTN